MQRIETILTSALVGNFGHFLNLGCIINTESDCNRADCLISQGVGIFVYNIDTGVRIITLAVCHIDQKFRLTGESCVIIIPVFIRFIAFVIFTGSQQRWTEGCAACCCRRFNQGLQGCCFSFCSVLNTSSNFSVETGFIRSVGVARQEIKVRVTVWSWIITKGPGTIPPGN